jgi:predicted amidophosphoribosyltransferase
MNKFMIYNNQYLKQNIQGFYNCDYTGYGNIDNPNYINDLKNTFNSYSKVKLDNAIEQLYNILKVDLSKFSKGLTICVVPRSKAENTYTYNQLLFKKVVKKIAKEFGFKDGSDYIVRHTDTKTTHLSKSQYAGNGDLPYPGITKNTCKISHNVLGESILLIDDIYTNNVNIDEDAIQSLLDNGANSVIFYSVAKTRR